MFIGLSLAITNRRGGVSGPSAVVNGDGTMTIMCAPRACSAIVIGDSRITIL